MKDKYKSAYARALSKKNRIKTARSLELCMFPPSKTVVLRYCDNFAVTSTVGVMASQKFRCNSIYDPDYTGVGHQPMFHDQYALFYNHYRVTSAKIKVQWCLATANDATSPYMIGIHTSDDLTIPLDYQTIVENKRGVTKYIARYTNMPNTFEMSYSFNGSKFFGDKAKGDSTQSVFGSDPAELAYFNVWVQSADQVSSVSPIRGIVTIDYTCVLSEPKDVAQS